MLEVDGSDEWLVFMKKNLLGWFDFDGFLFNMVEEIDYIGLFYFCKIIGGKLVWLVGLVLFDVGLRLIDEDVKVWFDLKLDYLVVYVCFGLMNFIF